MVSWSTALIGSRTWAEIFGTATTMAAATGAGTTAVVARRCVCSLLFVIDELAYDEHWRSFDLRARRAFPRLKAAAIGAVDGALLAGCLTRGREPGYTQIKQVCCPHMEGSRAA